jgi:hypothetical protein
MTLLRSLVARLRDFLGQFPFFNEETRVARFIVLAESAGGFSVPHSGGINDRHFLDINAPGVVPQSFSVIFLQTVHSGRPSFSVRLNTAPLTHHTFTDDGPHSFHEIVPAGALKAEGNELVFAVTVTGEGSVRFSDVVILYTSSELTVKTPPVLSPD